MLLDRVSPPLMLKIKRWAYLLFLFVPALPPIGWFFGEFFDLPNLFSLFGVFVIFGVVPILDLIFGQETNNPGEEHEKPEFVDSKWFIWLPLTAVPIQIALLIWSTWLFANYEAFSLLGKLGFALSVGACSGVHAITIAHELVHKNTQLETWAGGLLLALVTYAGFKVEHVRGHHVHVSTPMDASSSRYNQSVYPFVCTAFVENFKNAWRLEAKRLHNRKLPALHWSNELIWWYGISALITVGLWLAFGPLGAVFFLLQSFFAAAELEVINYIEHYGLHRRKQADGRYERVTPEHSWNSDYFLTNMFLFQLQRHSDHHAFPRRRYQMLRHFDNSPQLPAGYATMVVLALFPPLWRRVMNPRVEAYYKGELDQLAA
jgi:alkane 1-monooxygenase